MSALLLKDIGTLVTMTPGQAPLHDVSVLIEDDRIAAVGRDLAAPPGARVISGRDRVVYPGFVNTHHHLYQTLTRNLPAVQNAKLFDWLVGLYEVWRELDAEAVEVSTRVGVGELLLSGCTTTTDHFYLFPKKAPADLLDVEIETALATGIRFHPTRGSMSRGRSARAPRPPAPRARELVVRPALFPVPATAEAAAPPHPTPREPPGSSHPPPSARPPPWSD